MHDFATAVKAIATDESLTHDELVEQISALADAVLKQETPSRAEQEHVR
jgi:tRNA U54 and U55 pseudouridine synthase Pus10